jgi:DNA end-binding protein Ku
MAATARPYWTGFLKLSLVTIGVRLYTATTEKERIHFHRIHQPSGERVRYQTVVPGIGPVERDEIVKGYEYEKGRYVTVGSDDLDKLRLETTDTIDISEFVRSDELDPVYFDKPYYLVPEGTLAKEGYRVIREALHASETVAIGQVVINARERIVVIRPYSNGLLINALRFPEEIRAADDFFAEIGEGPTAEDELVMMQQIIARRTRKFAPEKFVDHYQTALRELIERKLAGKLPERPTKRKPAQIINLMDALKRSFAEEGGDKARAGSAPRTAPAAKTRSRSTRSAKVQPSLLLPVSGGRGRSAKAPAEAPKRRRRA